MALTRAKSIVSKPLNRLSTIRSPYVYIDMQNTEENKKVNL